MDVAFAVQHRQIVVLEFHTLLSELFCDALDISADLPGNRGRLVRPGELRVIDAK